VCGGGGGGSACERTHRSAALDSKNVAGVASASASASASADEGVFVGA
jgi:hypothetical protein